MIINNNSVEQINVALLDIDKKLKTTSVTSSQLEQIQKQLDNVQRTLRETAIGLSSGATYNINITGNASSASYATEAGSAKVTATAQSAEIANHANTADSATNATNAKHATNANLSKTLDTVNGDKLQIGSGTAQNITNAKHATIADNGVPAYSAGDAGKNLAVNSSGNAVEWVKPQTIKFVDYKTNNFTFSSPTDQKKIELSLFGPEVTEDNVLSFMVIYWTGVYIVAQGDWAKSQGTGSSGLACALHSLNNGTGWCVVRCVYLA